MNPFEKNFAKRLRLARSLKGMSQQDLATEIAATRQFINQLESNKKVPSEELLGVICEALSVSEHFFSLPLDREVTPENCHFRKRKTTTQSLANQVASYATIFDNFIDVLQLYIDFPSSDPLDLLENTSQSSSDGLGFTKREIEDIAKQFRENLQLGTDTPIDNVTNILESCGVFLTTFGGVSDKVDALSFSSKHHVVLRNTSKESAARQRFDLSHELGHLILHQGVQTGEGRYEAEADYFASCFLFPTSSFISEFKHCITDAGSFRWRNILALKERWKFSQKAIIYRANSLGLINSRQYRNANIYLATHSKNNKQEALDESIPLEEPTMIQEAVKQIIENLGISFSELASKVGLQGEYLSDLLDLPFKEEGPTNILAFRPKSLSW